MAGISGTGTRIHTGRAQTPPAATGPTPPAGLPAPTGISAGDSFHAVSPDAAKRQAQLTGVTQTAAVTSGIRADWTGGTRDPSEQALRTARATGAYAEAAGPGSPDALYAQFQNA